MKNLISLIVALSMAMAGPVPFAFAQDNRPGMLGTIEPGTPQFSQQELDQMLAPIALYPDSLLSQILMAATYPLEVAEAARWSRSFPSLKGEDAVRAVEQQEWDPSVKSLTAFPQVLSMMEDKAAWVERLGNAFLGQQEQVTDTVQMLRQKAYAAGNLQSNEQMRVEQQGNDFIVEPANPQAMVVPYYDPNIVYGGWWYPSYPPVFWAPPMGYYAPARYNGFWIGPAVLITAGFFFGAFDWHRRHVQVVNTRPFYFRNSGPSRSYAPMGQWQHDPVHRRGIGYRDEAIRQRYSRPGGSPVNAQPQRRGYSPNATPGGMSRDRQTTAPGFAPRDRTNTAPNYAPRDRQNVTPNVQPNATPRDRQHVAPNVQPGNAPRDRQNVAPNVQPGNAPRPPRDITPNAAPRTPNAPAPVRSAPPAPPPVHSAPVVPNRPAGNDKSRDRGRDNPQENRDRRGSNDGTWHHAPMQLAAHGGGGHRGGR